MSESAPKYTEEETRRYLTWLAQGMIRHGQSIFLIESLQPSWLAKGRGLWLFASYSSIPIGMFWGFLVMVMILSRAERWVEEGSPADFLPTLGLIFTGVVVFHRSRRGYDDRIRPVGRLGWSFRELWASYCEWWATCREWWARYRKWRAFLPPIFVMLIPIGFVAGFVRAVRPMQPELSTTPNFAIHQSMANGRRFLVLSVIFVAVSFFTHSSLLLGLGCLMFLVLYSASWYGVLEAFEHYLLRCIIRLYGYGPLRYVRFLDYAANELGFLQKAGGGYIFLHRSLMEYFAGSGDEASREAA